MKDMFDCRTNKIIAIALIMNKEKYATNEVVNRRINNYHYQENTVVTHDNEHIKVSTETNVKGVYNVLMLFPDGVSKLHFEFDKEKL